jgi:hypothetical protein
MRTLSPALLAAQQSSTTVPYLETVISDRVGGIRRLTWTRHYTGAEPDGHHAACVPGDGSLIRARVSGGRVYYQRVTAPGPGSDFSPWTDLGPCAGAGVALCADGSRLLLLYVDVGGTVIRVRESTDNGATLGAPVTAATASGAVTWLAADLKPGSDACAVYSVGANVFSAKRTAGAWATPAAWTNSAASITGLACYHHGDWNLAVTGSDAAGRAFAWTCIFGDGFAQPLGTWSPLREVTRASSGSGVTFRAPFLSRPDTYRLSFVEKYTGTVAYSRPYHSYTPATADFAANLWREPVPFDLASDWGQAIAFSPTAAWLSTPSGVWSAPLAIATLDVSADIIECVAVDRPFDGRLRLVLRNDDGRYSTLPAPLHLGAEVRVSPGYVTTGGAEASDGPAYWIGGIEHVSGKGQGAVVVTGLDAWGLLDGWRARRTYAWAVGEKNVFGILQYLFARAGLEFSGSGASPESSSLFPAFTVHPGQSALDAVRRLFRTVPDVVFLRGEFAFLKEPLASEATAFTYGTDHPILAARYGDEPAPATRVQVHGKNVFTERFDWPGIATAGSDRLVEVLDANVTAQTQAEDRADAELRRAAIGSQDGEITVSVNCGQELYDVIELTDAVAGLSAAKRRVVGVGLRYSTGKVPCTNSGSRWAGPD